MTDLPSSFALRHFAKVVESSDDAIVSKDLDGIVTSWNKAAERMFGYSAEEAVGRSIRMIIPADKQSEEDEVLARIRSGQPVSHFETIRQRKDGTLLPISLTVSPIFDDTGVVIGASKIARDISDRRLGDFAARRLAAVVQSSDDAIVTKDLTGTITSWNPAAERMFGYSEAEAIGRSVRMLIPNDLQPEEDTVLAKIRAGEMVDHYETVRRRKDGTLVSISLTVSPIRNDAGVVIGASKIARDVTERSRLLAAAQEQAHITEKLNEVGAVVASTLEHEKIVQKVTDVATELTRAEFGAFFYNVLDPQSGEVYTLHTVSGVPKEAFGNLSHPRETAMIGPTFHGERAIRLDDVTADARFGKNAPYYGIPGGHLPVRSYLAVPVRAVSGEVLGGLFFGHARAGMFTEQHERLAVGIAAWATVALENARLYVEAHNANRMKDEFLAVLSHELRTPLNAIVGYSRLLRGGILSGEKAARGFETLERNAAWLTQIVEDVLDVSRIVAGKIRLDVRPLELPLLVHNSVATVQPAADAKGVRIEMSIDPRIGSVSGDPDRLQQVMWNLLSNAVKFTPEGGAVHVRLERVDSQVELAVSDTGMGIAPEFLPHVFERFRQAEGSITRKTGGLGLGLAIVRHIVEMHGGTVHAASAGEGLGATFRVRLPPVPVRAVIQDGRPPQLRPERLEILSTLGDLRGTRVLAVDDEEDARTLLRVALESAGAEVTTLASGQTTLDRLEVMQPDVLVVDLGMPDMDGFELLARIRASANTDVRRIPAAALTAFARSEDRTKALKSGFEIHLAKPVDPAELVESVATLAKRGRKQTPQ